MSQHRRDSHRDRDHGRDDRDRDRDDRDRDPDYDRRERGWDWRSGNRRTYTQDGQSDRTYNRRDNVYDQRQYSQHDRDRGWRSTDQREHDRDRDRHDNGCGSYAWRGDRDHGGGCERLQYDEHPRACDSAVAGPAHKRSADDRRQVPQCTSGAAFDPRQLTAKIKQASTVEELLQLHELHSTAFDDIHISATWTKLKNLNGRLSESGLKTLVRHTLQMTKKGEMGARQMANVAHAVVKCALRGTTLNNLFDALASASVARVREFNPQALANTAWAYATAGHAAPQLLDALASASAARVREFNPQELANTAWAYATAGHAAPQLLDALASASVARVREFNPQNLANTAWAYAVLDVVGGLSLVTEGAVDAHEHTFSVQGMRQLHQWALWCSERGALSRLPDALRARCQDAFASQESQPSLLQSRVVATLRAMEINVSEEVRTQQGFSLDAVVEFRGGKVAIEVDGPTHFVGLSRAPTGSTILKHRQLRSAGWQLAVIPYWEWDALEKRDEEARMQYLEALLLQA